MRPSRVIRIVSDDAKWLSALPTSYEDELRYYVHAGIRPGIPLKEQNDVDRLWIRDLFLQHKAPHEKYVVHGHTPVRKPDVQANRINIDTGLVFGGRLTAAVFDDLQAEAIDLFQVKATSHKNECARGRSSRAVGEWRVDRPEETLLLG
jgi:serine/threonine protein phosphatase 1